MKPTNANGLKMDAEIWTSKELAEFLRIHISTAYRMLKTGQVAGAFRAGSDWRIKASDAREAFTKGTRFLTKVAAVALLAFVLVPRAFAGEPDCHRGPTCHLPTNPNLSLYVETASEEVAGHQAATIEADCEGSDVATGGGFQSAVVDSKVKNPPRVYIDSSMPAYQNDAPETAPIGWTSSVLNTTRYPVTITTYATCVESR